MSVSKFLLSALVLSIGLNGAISSEASAAAHRQTHTAKAQKNKLHPSCKRYLERRAAWYRNKPAEVKENRKAAKAFRRLPYKEQRIQCNAAYEAFDDFDHGKFRR